MWYWLKKWNIKKNQLTQPGMIGDHGLIFYWWLVYQNALGWSEATGPMSEKIKDNTDLYLK